MKKILRLSVLLLAAGLVISLAGCPKEPEEKPVDNGIDYENYLTNFSIKVKNETSQKLVAFKGAPSASTLISGVRNDGVEQGLKKDTSLFSVTGDFVLFLVTEADYLTYKDNLTALANRPFTRIYAFYNTNAENKIVYRISGFLGGNMKIILQNSTQYNVELRRDGIQGEVIGYTAAQTYNTTFNVETGDYIIFPVFRKFNQSRGEIITVFPKYNSGELNGTAVFEYFSLAGSDTEAQLRANEWITAGFEFKTGSAYLVIQNNHGTGMTLYDGMTALTTSTGGQVINSNRELIFQIDMQKKPNGQAGEYLDSRTVGGYKIGTPAYAVSVPSFEYHSDKIYQLTVSGNNPGNIQLSEITEAGTMSFE
jgi:hypothetical protein